MYGIFWTTFLAAVVTVACMACQLAFTSAVLSRKGIGNMVKSEVFVRVPLDMPGDVICLPVALFRPSVMDFVIPPMFAAVVVTASACFVYAVEIWDIL
ncbi:hypothetical protein SUGI_0267770 [Cryptomeria japonica]|nr:hypothetical protein SUGI_0267770 [Cryptomeria japonica]